MRNYRHYFYAQSISLTGTNLQQLAISWLMYSLTRSSTWVGWLGVATMVPAFFLSPLGGYYADKLERKKLLIAAEIACALQAMVLFILVRNNWIQAWHVILAGVFNSCILAFEMGARHAFSKDLVGQQYIASAVSINTMTFNLSRIIGPLVGAATIAAVGLENCFLINSLSYSVVLFVLITMRLPKKAIAKVEADSIKVITSEIILGFKYILNDIFLIRCFAAASIGSIFGWAIPVIFPQLVVDVLHAGPSMVAYLTGAMSLGAILGSLTIVRDRSKIEIERILLQLMALSAVALIVLGFSKSIVSALVLLAIFGFCLITIFPIVNTAIQTFCDDRMRGRVLGNYMMVFTGSAPLGGLIIGKLGDLYGPLAALRWFGLLMVLIVFVAFVFSRGRLRSMPQQPL